MGDRYYIKCPKCGRTNYFGNWSNYVTKCECGVWLVVEITVNEICEEYAKELISDGVKNV